MGKKRRGSKWQREHRPLSRGSFGPGGLSAGRVIKRDGEHYVRGISSVGAQKEYVCPGCYHMIPPGTPHVVAWPAESIFGEQHAASERRHWHSHCWRIRP